MRLISKTRCSLLLLTSILFFISFPQPSQVGAELPWGLQIGDYAQYRQEFSTGETHQLHWSITYIDYEWAEIDVISHGILFNDTLMEFVIELGGGTMRINLSSWEIQEYPGYKVPFWIPTPITPTTPVNTLFDLNVTPTLVGPLEFDCLPTPRMCWMTDNHYTPKHQMQRYYDATTGFVLKIFTFIQYDGQQISVEETLNDTNISALQTIQAPTIPLFEIGFGIMICACISGLVLFIRHLRRPQLEGS